MRRHAKASTAGSTQRQARHLVLPASVFAAILAAMALIVAPASATKTHLFKETFGSAAQPSFTEARSLAVDQSTGDVLVMDAGAGTISRFNADGTPDDFSALGTNVIDGTGTGDETPQNGLSFSGAGESQIAIDESGGATDGDIYVTQGFPNLINIFSEGGEYLGQLSESLAGPFSEACGVAVDPTGAVYVGDYSGGIHKFVPAANPPVNADNTATFSSTSEPCTLAAGVGPTAGFLFATQYEAPISKLDSSSGELKYTVSSDNNTTLTVDPGTGHVYAVNGEPRIEEFDASGAGSATSVSSVLFGSGGRLQGIAVYGATGDFYVSRGEAAKVQVFGPLVTIPDATTGSASAIATTSATLNGTVNPDGVELSECSFEYGKTTSYGQSVPCEQSPATIGSGSSDIAVSANVSGLELGAEYHFRLVASNANGSVNGADEAFKLESPPMVKAEWARDVVFTEAALKAKINPEGSATTYKFEWGTTTAYGQSSPVGSLGADKADHVVGAFLDGLEPTTTYHYRVVATNSIGTTEGPDHTFTTYAHLPSEANCPNQTFRGGPSGALPDCRAYEMVSPVDKNGGDITTGCTSLCFRTEYIQSTPSGNKITYSAATGFGDSVANQPNNQYVATRGAGGWSTHSITPPLTMTTETPSFESNYQAFTADLSTAWLFNGGETPLVPGGTKHSMNLYMRDNAEDTYSLLVPGRDIDSFATLMVKGHSQGGSRVVFQSRQALTPEASAASEQSKVYEFADGELKLISILPGEASNPNASSVGAETPGAVNLGRGANIDHAVSDDGSRIFWTSTTGGFAGPGQIFVRVNGQTTISVSESVSAEDALFWTASADGSKAVFTIRNGSSDKKDLYEFDVDTGTPTKIAGEALGVAGASDDASYIYFASKEDLAIGATVGEGNLYLDHEGAITFIATLSKADFGGVEGIYSPVATRPVYRGSRVTPDGLHIAFMSDRSLTGYDNTDANNEKADEEVYLYGAHTDRLICASCNPSGARPVGELLTRPYSVRGSLNSFINQQAAAAWLPTWQHEQYATSPLTDDGNRLFFNSFDALVPQDNNGAQDVYQWEAQGSGSCRRASGCISLISTGEDPEESEFVDASPDGDSVFLRTATSIAPADPGLIDIYVARVGGGFPPPAEPTPCVGDACQSVPAAPNDPTPASAGFRGAGNPVTPKPRKSCRVRIRHGKASHKARHKKAKRCRGANRGAGR